jgi:hypothetical protein
MGIETVSLKTPTLDDVYLHFTGRQIREVEENQEAHVRSRFARRRARR